MTTFSLMGLFLRRLVADRRAWLLPVSAFAVVTALALSVAGGARYFFTLDSEMVLFYQIFAGLAVVLLLVPLSALAAAAARLLARRRDERLSSLRLIGASNVTVRALAMSEAMTFAAAGAVVGVVGYLLLMPVVGLLHFNGAPLGSTGVWLGIPGIGLVVAAVLILAALSALAGLRSIEITPLGVRTRQRPARVHWVRIVAVVVLVIAAQLAGQATGVGDVVLLVTLMIAALAVPLVALHFIGPWLIKIRAQRHLRTANTAEKLIAARTVLESPQLVWRHIGGVALTTYIGVVGGAGMAMVNLASTESMNADDRMLIADVRTGVLLTMVISFLLTACSVAINQTAAVLDRAELHRGLYRLGLTASQLNEIRRRSVMGPLLTVVVFTLICAGASTLPLLGMAVVLSPLTMAVVALCLVTGVLLVRGGVAVGSPSLQRVISQPVS